MSAYRMLRLGVPTRLEELAAGRRARRWAPGLLTSIARADQMHAPRQSEHYFSVGRSALANIRQALADAGASEPRRVLDLPCGHGRVLRYLRQHWPTAELTAVELDRAAVDYCVATFAAHGVYSANPLSSVDVGQDFDLIWSGSLLTHLPADRWPEVLGYFRDRLSPTGLAVVTSHGRRSEAFLAGDLVARDVLWRVSDHYGLDPAAAQRLLEEYRDSGFGYADYPGDATGYGISLSHPDWVRQQLSSAGVRLVYTREHGWDHHQDVWGFTR